MKIPLWCRECCFYYNGMTPEDYLYLQYCLRNGNSQIVDDLQRGKITLPPIDSRTKEDVFQIFGGDVDYIFDPDVMC